jgi:hypothetical protein
LRNITFGGTPQIDQARFKKATHYSGIDIETCIANDPQRLKQQVTQKKMIPSP